MLKEKINSKSSFNEPNKSIDKKRIVWALYDDSNCSYKKAIKKYFNGEFEVHSVGINDVTFEEKKDYFYHKINLSIINFNLIEDLNKLPHPDIILASPPCESWSGADCNGIMFRSINENGDWNIKNKEYYDEYNKKCHPVKRRYFEQKEEGRILGEATIGACIKIINHYKPKIWIIENPRTSKTWEFQKHHWNFEGKNNLAYYSSYDPNYSLKPTYFKSNIKLELNKNRVKGDNDHMARGNYLKRSSIPESLVKDIIIQINKKLESNNDSSK